jgi:hypothetical protein
MEGATAGAVQSVPIEQVNKQYERRGRKCRMQYDC